MAKENLEATLSLLHESARTGDACTVGSCLQLLLPRYGWDVCEHYDHSSGWTPIHHACSAGNLLCLQYLIPSHLDLAVAKRLVNRSTLYDGLRPAHLAAAAGHVGCLNWLLQWSCDLNVKDASGEYPLDKAVTGGHSDCCQIMLSAGGLSTGHDEIILFPPVVVQSSKRKHDFDDQMAHVEKRARRLTLDKRDCFSPVSSESSPTEVMCDMTADVCTDGMGYQSSTGMDVTEVNTDCMDVSSAVTMAAAASCPAEFDELGTDWGNIDQDTNRWGTVCHGINSYPWDIN